MICPKCIQVSARLELVSTILELISARGQRSANIELASTDLRLVSIISRLVSAIVGPEPFWLKHLEGLNSHPSDKVTPLALV